MAEGVYRLVGKQLQEKINRITRMAAGSSAPMVQTLAIRAVTPPLVITVL